MDRFLRLGRRWWVGLVVLAVLGAGLWVTHRLTQEPALEAGPLELTLTDQKTCTPLGGESTFTVTLGDFKRSSVPIGTLIDGVALDDAKSIVLEQTTMEPSGGYNSLHLAGGTVEVAEEEQRLPARLPTTGENDDWVIVAQLRDTNGQDSTSFSGASVQYTIADQHYSSLIDSPLTVSGDELCYGKKPDPPQPDSN